MAAASPRRGVSMGDTSHHVSEEGLYFSTVLTVCRPKMKGNSDHLTNMSFIMKSLDNGLYMAQRETSLLWKVLCR